MHNAGPVTIDYNQMATAQKLLLFWRKPAVRVFPGIQKNYIDSSIISANVGGMALRSNWPKPASLQRLSSCGQGESGLWNSV